MKMTMKMTMKKKKKKMMMMMMMMTMTMKKKMMMMMMKKIYYYIHQILIGIQNHSEHLYHHTNLVYCNTFQKDKNIHDIYHTYHLY